MNKLIDFNNSFTTIAFDSQNTWRQKIVSKIQIYDTKENLIKEAYLNHNCLSEHVYKKDGMLMGEYTWQAIIANDFLNALRVGCKVKPKNDIINAKDILKSNIVESEQVYCCMQDDEVIQKLEDEEFFDILCEVRYKIPNGSVKVFFPGTYINYCNIRKQYQFDVGPVLFLNNHKVYSSLEQVQVSYCAFGNSGHVEFQTLQHDFLKETGRLKWIKKIMNFIFGSQCSSTFYNKNHRVSAQTTLWIRC